MAKHVYVHIPFCEAKCSYCSFFSRCNFDLVPDFFDALGREIDGVTVIDDVNPDGADTIYFGGGTPSSVSAELVCDALGKILDKFSIDPGRSEITIEVNPHSLTEEKAAAYRMAGFNRVSMGVQSLHDSTLRTLGRLHSSSLAKNAINILHQAGFENISCDLMLGIPGQSLEELLEDARYLVNQGINHISMYSLSIEEGTPFEKMYPDLSDVVSEDLERQMYHSLRDFLDSNGIHPYEISNCGMKGYESIHNNSYWEGYEYYALGAGSHGFLENVRFCHPDDIEAYIVNPCMTDTEEVLDADDRFREYCMLRLRTSDGISRQQLFDRFGVILDEEYADVIARHIKNGYLTDDGENVRLTSLGLDLANIVFEDFL